MVATSPPWAGLRIGAEFAAAVALSRAAAVAALADDRYLVCVRCGAQASVTETVCPVCGACLFCG